MYVVYDMKDNECCLGIFETRQQVAEYFKTTANSIGSIICRKQTYKQRYLIEKVGE